MSCEEHGPRSLIDQAKAAEQEESPFVWSVIGAIGEVTGLEVTTAPTTQPDPDALASYRSQGERGPSSACAKVCYGPSREDSIKAAHRSGRMPTSQGSSPKCASPKHFEQIGELSQDFFDVYAAEVLPALREVGS